MAKAKNPKDEVIDENSPNIEPVQPILEEEQLATKEIAEVEETKESTDTQDSSEKIEPKSTNKLKKIWALYRTKKKFSIPVSAVFILIILFAIPLTRYSILGLVMKKNVVLYTLDDKSKSSIYNSTVSIDGKTPGCASHGSPYPNCIANISVGPHTVKVSAANYQDVVSKITIGLGKSKYKNV